MSDLGFEKNQFGLLMAEILQFKKLLQKNMQKKITEKFILKEKKR